MTKLRIKQVDPLDFYYCFGITTHKITTHKRIISFSAFQIDFYLDLNLASSDTTLRHLMSVVFDVRDAMLDRFSEYDNLLRIDVHEYLDNNHPEGILYSE